ncbi:phage tail protein [Pantoea septica]|uniref:phage tail protein n=1 Tax=Pantoea septica TaxID=472695 RepID=UPI0028A2A965|nr:phage tail protein [Pantoea septica]
MTQKFYAIVTNLGAAKIANAAALGTKLNITQMAVGDGGGTLPTPNASQTKLVNEVRRAAINTLSIDPANASQVIAEQVIPETEGGFWIREMGLFDADGTLIAVCNTPETYKPALQEGSGRTQTVRMLIIVNSTDAITLKIDPSVVLATRQYVDNAVIEVKSYTDKALAAHVAADNPHKQYLQTANALSEIKDAALVSELLKNVGLIDADGYGGRLIGVRVITSSQVYTAKEGTKAVIVEAVGGGGGGGGTYNTTTSGYKAVSGGGGAGGYGKSRYTSDFSNIAVTIGIGGSGGAANSSSAGGSGGATSFGTKLVCYGGSGGPPSTQYALPMHTSSAISGTVTGANLAYFRANQGTPGYYAVNGWLSGAGASSPFGGGGTQVGLTGAGVNATGYGSGGSGASTAEMASGQPGGAGTPGLVIVWEYA